MSAQASAPAAAPVRIGCSGWIYKHWRGLFYPEKLPVKRWFEFYSSVRQKGGPPAGSGKTGAQRRLSGRRAA